MALSARGFSLESRGLSAEQQAKVLAFKRLLQQSGAWDDGCFDDHDCARFLKARNYDPQAAKQMWDGMRAWRRENRVDTIRDWFVFNERREYDRLFPTGLHKTDKEGHPVLIQQLGRVNISALYKLTNDDRIRLAHIAENEHLRRVVFPACSRVSGRPIDQLFTIIDLEGVAFTSVMRTTSLLKMFMAMDSNNYPETLAHMTIINAPGWFSTSWSAVKSVLSGDTVRKIEILGKDYQSALLRHIPRANLLVEYGGLSRGCVTDNEGPWQLPETPAPPPEPLLPPPQPLLPPMPQPGVTGAGAGGADMGELAAGGGGDGDQRSPRDVATRRSLSPVRPGAKAAATGVVAAPGAAGVHPAPMATPPAAKRPHVEEVQMQPHPQQQLGAPPSSGSPAPSVSDSDSAQSMAAPLMSNFLPSSSESPSPQHHQHSHPQQPPLPQHRQQQQQAVPPLPPSQQLSASGAMAAAAPGAGTPPVTMPQRHSSSGGAGGLVAGFVASLQAAVVGHAGAQQQHPPQGAATAAATDGGVLRPPAGPLPTSLATNPAGPHTPLHNPQQHPLAQNQQTPPPQQQQQLPMARGGSGGAAGPAQLLLSSPREDATGPGTMLSAVSTLYSPPSLMSPLSPADMQAVADAAISARRTDGATSLLGSSAAMAAGTGRRSGGVNVSGGGVAGVGVSSFASVAASTPTGGLTAAAASFTSNTAVSAFASAIIPNGELLLPAAATPGSGQLSQQQAAAAAQQQQYQCQSLNDMDDAESVRASVMSQRSFYSALSHLDASSCSGITSPAEGSDNARRWSAQRELHAAAIASAVAATAERRAAAAAAAAAGTPTAAAAAAAGGGTLSKLSASHPAHTVGIPPAGALSGVSYIVPPAATQAFGSYLDQPPPYGALRSDDGLGSFTNTDAPVVAKAEDDRSPSAAGVSGSGGGGAAPAAAPGHRSRGDAAQIVDAVAIQMGNDSNGGASVGIGGSGMSRSPSAAAMEDCSLGAGAVRWARGWFFRRRNYGRLVDDGAGDGAGGMGGGGSHQGSDGGRQGGGSMMTGRGKGSGAGLYAAVGGGPCATSPSKIVPKMPHHSRGDSWEWDQPSPYDIDQTYGRTGGSGAGGGMMHREMSFGRGAERRRLLRSESPGRRRRLEEYCGCMPCCTIM
ncbi:hypothetical protein PLESTM_000864700 [Pleodorina starrii]|nr:hypothetical protein PLESTM_000864700 [Pleodorina starrii]